MRLVILIALTVAVVGLSCGAVLKVDPTQMSIQEKLDEINAELKWRFDPMGDQLKEVGSALWDVAKDTGKSLLGQSLQAVAGALINSLQGIDLSGTIGKRELAGWNEAFLQLVKTAYNTLDRVYEKTADRFNKIISEILSPKPNLQEGEVKQALKDAAVSHEVEVRGVLSDTLNTGIDYIKSLYLKLKQKLIPDVSPLSPPLTISKRAILEAAGKLGDHLKRIHESVKPQIDTLTTIATDLATALGHHAGRMLDHAKSNSAEEVKGLVSTLADHFNSAKEKLSDIKDTLSQQIQSILSSVTSE